MSRDSDAGPAESRHPDPGPAQSGSPAESRHPDPGPAQSGGPAESSGQAAGPDTRPGPGREPLTPADQRVREEGDPGLRGAGPADEDLHGVVEDGPGQDEPEAVPDDLLEQETAAGGGHVSADVDWAPSDSDDPDAGSGRTDNDPGYRRR